jgi:hypothetical protein
MAGFKSELAADIISETVADLRRNQHVKTVGAEIDSILREKEEIEKWAAVGSA